MKIDELIYKTPEVSEEKLLELLEKRKGFLNLKQWSRNRYSSKEILDEWDLIQVKQSKLSKNQRDQICAIVSACLIEMVKGDDKNGGTTEK